MGISQETFTSLYHKWANHRLSRNMKLRLYQLSVCSILTHPCEAWCRTKAVPIVISGFNSSCMHVTTGYEYTKTVIAPRGRLRYLIHMLRFRVTTLVMPDRLYRWRQWVHYEHDDDDDDGLSSTCHDACLASRMTAMYCEQYSGIKICGSVSVGPTNLCKHRSHIKAILI